MDPSLPPPSDRSPPAPALPPAPRVPLEMPSEMLPGLRQSVPAEPLPLPRAAPAEPTAEVAPASVPGQGQMLGRPLTLVRLAVFFYGVVALFSIGYAIFSDGIGTLLGEGPPRIQHLLVAVGVGLLIVAVSRVGVRVWRPLARASEAAATMLGPITWSDALILALLSGTAEELLFRGALWPTLHLLGTTLLFGLVHLAPRRALWVYPLFAAFCGLLLGLLRNGTGSVFPPMLAHIVVNAFNLAWLGRQSRAATARAATPTPAV